MNSSNALITLAIATVIVAAGMVVVHLGSRLRVSAAHKRTERFDGEMRELKLKAAGLAGQVGKDMTTHNSCPNCTCNTPGTDLYRCGYCRRFFCDACEAGGYVIAMCPFCTVGDECNPGDQIGTIGPPQSEEDDYDDDVEGS